MASYRICFRNRRMGIVGRDDFDAVSESEALVVAEALCEACLDVVESYEVWEGSKLIASQQSTMVKTAAAWSVRNDTQERVIEVEERLSASNFAIARSRRLLERLRHRH